MNARWFERHDWPSDWELATRAGLMAAVRALPGGDALADDDAEGRALRLLAAANAGRDEALPRNLNAAQGATEADLRKLHDLADKLATHMEGLRRPAVGALFAEGASDLFTIAARLRRLQDDARAAFSEAGDMGGAAGRRPKVEAAAVTEAAAQVFEGVTGRAPTFTSDPDTGRLSGPWPEFLGEVFAALGVDASAEAQARDLRKKTASKKAN